MRHRTNNVNGALYRWRRRGYLRGMGEAKQLPVASFKTVAETFERLADATVEARHFLVGVKPRTLKTFKPIAPGSLVPVPDGPSRSVTTVEVGENLVKIAHLEHAVVRGARPKWVQCKHCGKPVKVTRKSGTVPTRHTDCPRRVCPGFGGEVCGKKISRNSSGRCERHGARKRTAEMTPDKRADILRALKAAIDAKTPEQRSESARKANAAQDPVLRAERCRKANAASMASLTDSDRAARGTRIRTVTAMMPQHRRAERGREANATRRARRGVSVDLLDEVTIRRWMDDYRAEKGAFPSKDCADSAPSGDRWGALDDALTDGRRGLPGGSSLAKLRGAKAALTEAAIRQLADDYRVKNGVLPTQRSTGRAASGDRWDALDAALIRGYRGLPGGSSLAKLLGSAPPAADAAE